MLSADGVRVHTVELPAAAFTTDWYAAFGVPHDASIDEVRKAFVQIVDRVPAEQQDDWVNAYAMLIDVDKRRKYDIIRAYQWSQAREQLLHSADRPVESTPFEQFDSDIGHLGSILPADIAARHAVDIHRTGRLGAVVSELRQHGWFVPGFGGVRIDPEDLPWQSLLANAAVTEHCATWLEGGSPKAPWALKCRDFAERHKETLREVWGAEASPERRSLPEPYDPYLDVVQPEKPARSMWGTRRSRPGPRRGGRRGRHDGGGAPDPPPPTFG